VDDEDAADALPQQSRQRAEQAAANYDVVVVPGRLAGDLDDG
jgi:putative intracellular protease/amidase